MDPFLVWLTAAILTLGGFTGFLVKWIIAHLESDLAYARRTASRGVATAEEAAQLAERHRD